MVCSVLFQCLIRNPLVLTQILCNVTESVTFKASSHYLPLYLQTQFVMTPKSAAMLTGRYFFLLELLQTFYNVHI